MMTPPVDAVLGAVIAGLRARREWTQAQLAERASTSQAVLSRIEAGRLQPTVPLYRALAQAFGLMLVRLEARVAEAEQTFARVGRALKAEGIEMTPALVGALVRALPTPGPVTIVFHGGLFHGIWRSGTVRHITSNGLLQANVRRSDEGVVWIRGHHDPDSVEAIALLAAYALRSEQSSP